MQQNRLNMQIYAKYQERKPSVYSWKFTADPKYNY